MAIINLSTNKQLIQPGYNQNVFVFDSDNKNEPGFRYVVDIYQVDPDGTVGSNIYEGRVAPRPVDGYGYIDVQKIVSNYIQYQITFTQTVDKLTDNILHYQVNVGEEYIVSWPYDDTTFVTGGRTSLTQSPTVTAHTFVAGDPIIVVPDDPTLFPACQGLFQVYDIPNSYEVVINLGFETTAANPGSVKYADNRTTIFRDLYLYEDNIVWNGAANFVDLYNTNWTTNYLLNSSSTTKQFTTNLPDNFKMSTTQDAYLYGLFDDTTITPYRIYYQNDNGDTFYLNINFDADDSRYYSIPAGPNNIDDSNVVSGTGPLIKSDTLYYDIWAIQLTGLAQISKKYRIYIDNKCKISEYEILFEDRLGSFLSYSFSGRSRKTGNITKSSYNKQIGDFDAVADIWKYNINEDGMVHNSIILTEEIELNTMYMNYEMDNYFVELLTSGNTYLKINDGVSNNYVKCIISDTGYKLEERTNKDLRMRTIKVKYAVQNNINI